MTLQVLILVKFSEVSVQLLWITLIALGIATALLFFTSLITRMRRWIRDKKEAQIRDKMYPVIISYLSGEISEDIVAETFEGSGLEYGVFEDIIIDMLDRISGEERARLIQILSLPPFTTIIESYSTPGEFYPKLKHVTILAMLILLMMKS